MPNVLRLLLIAAVLVSSGTASAQTREAPLADVLDLDATVSSEVAPDLAVITLAIVREGKDVAPLTRDVDEAMAKAFADAKTVPGVVAANGGYSTSPLFESVGLASNAGQGPRTGWQVRAEIVLKSRNFEALGTLVGRLSTSLQIARSGFEISPELKAKESAALLDRGARAFQDKAAAAARAFGYAGYSIRQITLGSANQNGGGRPMAFAMAKSSVAAPLPIESGQVTLTLAVNGSVLLKH